ncbi:MAG: BamA/TamA family outer membrane protein [Alphaproteobacteria bacterium]|nr:BamA/TamA family outer membrane protein [Alphaproteobacteria bacterium]
MLLSLLSGVLAQEPPEDPVAIEITEEAPAKRRWAGLAVPLISYDSNLLLGLGGFGQLIRRDFSGEQPYLANLQLQLFWTTGGYRNHYAQWDLPGLLGTSLRWSATIRRIEWTQAPYYGVGNDAPIPPGEPAEYFWYDQSRLSLRTQLRWTIRGEWEGFVDYRLRAEGVETKPDTLLAEERPLGIEGGRFATLGAGVLIDTRSEEINPYDGLAFDVSGRAGVSWLGSQYTVYGGTVGLRTWKALGGSPRWVWASHLLVDSLWGEVPFFDQAYFAGTTRGVIGGRWTLRGLPEERYRADGIALIQEELRFTAFEHDVKSAHLEWMLVPFVDLARLWAWEAPDPGRLHPHATGGMGLRLNLDDLLILRADLGVGIEEFTDGRAPSLQVYFLSEHPF